MISSCSAVCLGPLACRDRYFPISRECFPFVWLIDMSHATVSSLDEVHILLVEDNEIDVMAFQRGIKKNDVPNPLTVAENGQEALDILRGEHPDKSIGPHRMVFLDMNMPIMNGVGVSRGDSPRS